MNKKGKIQEMLLLRPLVVLHPPQDCRIYASGLIILEIMFFIWILLFRPTMVLHPPHGCFIYASGLIILENILSIRILRKNSLAPVDESKVHTHFTCYLISVYYGIGKKL